MLATLLFSLALANGAAACAPLDGWNAGREGRNANAACGDAPYQQAHRLGHELHRLELEREAIEARISGLPVAEQGAQRRRQRQIDNDLEAIRGVATVNGWPTGVTTELEEY